jgi:tetratricopeptide (TPR) repeat protein
VIKLSEILVQNGLKDESVQLLRVAYDDDANYLRSLLNGLASQGEFQQAIDLCMERSKIDDSPEFVSAVADCWMEHPELDSHAEAIEPILERGLKVHPESALMLESLGSLRLSQFRYEDAYRLLEAANRISPESLMTLNNLALAASEIPGKEALGLALIDRAIAKFGRIPDLIDSRGLVQLQNHLYREARQSFDDAFALRPDPIFRIHRIQVELAEPIELDLETVAESLDFERLQQTKLTPRERAVLDQLLAVSKKKSQVID